MKLGKKIMAGLLCFTLLLAVGCSSKTTSNEGGSAEKTETSSSSDEVNGVSLANPIKVDKEAGTVTVLSSVNGKYFNEPTRHASVFKDGTNGAKSILTAYATAIQFYDALVELGGKAGNNMTFDNAATTRVEGDKINAQVTWNGAGKVYDINEVIKDSNGKKIDLRFGGNLEAAKNKNTGCLTCLDSCPVGIISNATYTNGAVENRQEVKFTGNSEVLPEDGTFVAVTYSIQK